MNKLIASSLAGLALAAVAVTSSAQTTVAPDPAPAKVGVTQGTAVDAENKAVPRTDTATLVRTSKARRASATASSADGHVGEGNGTSVDGTIDNGPSTAARHARN